MNIVNYVQKFHRHPVTGQPLALKDIVTLTFHKNADGEYHCPVLHKVFTESTHIVAIRNTGHVYCYEVRPAEQFWYDSLNSLQPCCRVHAWVCFGRMEWPHSTSSSPHAHTKRGGQPCNRH